MSKVRKKMAKERKEIQVGDIVTPIQFHRNGKPIQPNHKVYSKPRLIGLVVRSYWHVSLGLDTIVISWYDPQDGSEYSKVGAYVKSSSAAYLFCLTEI